MTPAQPPVDPGAQIGNPAYAISASYRATAQGAPFSQGTANPMVEPVTHRELDAKLEVVEARATGRENTLVGRMDLLLEKFSNLSDKVTGYAGEVGKVREAVRSENIFTRWTIVVTMVTVALAFLGIVVATQGTMTAANGNVLGAVQAGLAMKQATAPVSPQAVVPPPPSPSGTGSGTHP
jgi:hypothetical protein